MPAWDPDLYARFADHRDRPFHDLVARVRAADPQLVADLGCGPGTLTRTLLDRWPGATVVGVDSSAEMIEAAQAQAGEGLTFELADLRSWVGRAGRAAYDVIISNATLQWVPRHLGLLPDLVDRLAPGGWLAIQVPGNHDAPLHAILRQLARREPYAAHVAGAADRFALPAPEDYLRALVAVGCAVDAWETTYQQVLPGEDAVFAWISGTGARPVLQALPDGLRQRFESEYRERLRAAYPRQGFGTVLPFRRVFAVAQRS